LDVFNELASAEGVESLDFTSTRAAVGGRGGGGGGGDPNGGGDGSGGGGGVANLPQVVDASLLPKVSLVDFELMTVVLTLKTDRPTILNTKHIRTLSSITAALEKNMHRRRI
jgi:hypothetical protein